VEIEPVGAEDLEGLQTLLAAEVVIELDGAEVGEQHGFGGKGAKSEAFARGRMGDHHPL